MRQLSIFDDGVRIATITPINDNILIFARSVSEWRAMKRLVDYTYPKGDLEKIASRAHEYNYSTELLNE